MPVQLVYEDEIALKDCKFQEKSMMHRWVDVR